MRDYSMEISTRLTPGGHFTSLRHFGLGLVLRQSFEKKSIRLDTIACEAREVQVGRRADAVSCVAHGLKDSKSCQIGISSGKSCVNVSKSL
jgi:hypothetical protein